MKNKTIFFYFIIIIFIIFLLSMIYLYINYNINLYSSDIINKNKYDKNKKTCILISGQIRGNFEDIYLTQKLFLINPLNADIFCVFDDNLDYNKKLYIKKLINPKNILWISDKNDLNNNLYKMYNKIYICNKLKKEYEFKNKIKYDVCIRIRPDLFIKSFIPDYIINNTDHNTFYTPSLNIFDFYTNLLGLGVTDQIFICNSNTMNIISNIFFSINNIKCNSSEISLKKYIKKNNINIHTFYNFKFIIYNYSYKSMFNLVDRLNNKKKDIFYIFDFNCHNKEL